MRRQPNAAARVAARWRRLLPGQLENGLCHGTAKRNYNSLYRFMCAVLHPAHATQGNKKQGTHAYQGEKRCD